MGVKNKKAAHGGLSMRLSAMITLRLIGPPQASPAEWPGNSIGFLNFVYMHRFLLSTEPAHNPVDNFSKSLV